MSALVGQIPEFPSGAEVNIPTSDEYQRLYYNNTDGTYGTKKRDGSLFPFPPASQQAGVLSYITATVDFSDINAIAIVGGHRELTLLNAKPAGYVLLSVKCTQIEVLEPFGSPGTYIAEYTPNAVTRIITPINGGLLDSSINEKDVVLSLSGDFLLLLTAGTFEVELLLQRVAEI